MTDIKRYTKKPITIEAVHLQGYGDFVRAAKWINQNGGSAVASLKNSNPDADCLIVQTIEGNMEAHLGWFVIRGIKGEFYPCDPEIFKLSYDQAEEPVTVVPEPEPIIAREPISLPRSGPRLSGGEALAVPV